LVGIEIDDSEIRTMNLDSDVYIVMLVGGAGSREGAREMESAL
jgi:hypothetical protein